MVPKDGNEPTKVDDEPLNSDENDDHGAWLVTVDDAIGNKRASFDKRHRVDIMRNNPTWC
jgi:hypothetical protein